MPTSKRRAVFTGLGLLTPIGSDARSFWDALVAGQCGIRAITHFDASSLPCQIAGEIPAFEPKSIVPKEYRKQLNKMARTVQLGLCAGLRAWENSGGPKKGDIDPFRFGVEYGCVMVATDAEDLAGGARVSTNGMPGVVDMAQWGKEGLRNVPPHWMLKYLPNMPACHASILTDAQGPNNTITAGDVAGLLALGEAYRILGRDLADYFLVGACEAKINPVSFSRHCSFTPLSRNSDPTTALRPFDADRDGTILGEAAAAFGLEELNFARKRSANILAEVVGFASGFDRQRKGSIFAGVIRNALKEAGITADDIDHVNASASGSPELDAFEARAIHEALGGRPVLAPRAQLGSSGAASGLVELAASVLALQQGQLPGTRNFAKADPNCPVSVHTGAPRPVSKPYAIKLSYTDLGQCAAVVIRRWDGE